MMNRAGFVWTEASGIHTIPTLEGGTFSAVYGMSPDGSLILGGDLIDGWNAGWIYKLNLEDSGGGSEGGGSGTIVDISKTQDAVTQVSTSQQDMIHQSQQFARSFMTPSLTAGFYRNFPATGNQETGPIVSSKSISSDLEISSLRLLGNNNSDASAAGLAVDISMPSEMRAGLSYIIARDDDSSDNVTFDGSYNTYGGYLAGGNGHNELAWSVSHTSGSGNVVLERPVEGEDVEAGVGTANLSTSATSLSVGKSFVLSDSDISSVELTVSNATAVRGAYTENDDIAFPVTYEETTSDLTTASVNLGYAKSFGNGWIGSVTAGLEMDISRSDGAITGSSSIPSLSEFSFTSPEVLNDTRLFGSVEVIHGLQNNAEISFGADVMQSAFSDALMPNLRVGYQVNF